MDNKKREAIREVALKEFGGKDGKEAMDDETKVKQLFSTFFNRETGRIGYEEAKDYTVMTEGDKAVLPLDIWSFVCKYAWKGSSFSSFDSSYLSNIKRHVQTQMHQDLRIMTPN